MRRVLLVLAHPDDEVLWAWPLLQQADKYELALVTLCANAHQGDGPDQAWYDVCAANSVRSYAPPLGYSQFYRLPTREVIMTLMSAVTVAQRAIQQAIADFQPEAVFTHNPWGEYGHGDHRLCFDLVSRLDVPLLLTDMCCTNKCHVSGSQMPAFYRGMFTVDKIVAHCTLDEDWYERMKAIYDQRNAWTWGGHEPVRETNLYLFGDKR